MTEKDSDSMAHVHIKPEYATSDVYSTSSEAPPAYKHPSSSVKIAKICAFTVIVSSFIIGSFILASAFVQARISCNEMQALDSVLEKELMLETIQQETPRAEALLDQKKEDTSLEGIDLQDIDKNEEKLEANVQSNKPSSSASDEIDDIQKNDYNMPLELDLSDFAAALLESNGKSHVNCVIERKHAVEMIDSPAQPMQLLFGYNIATDPKKQKVTGERISISCDTGSANGKRDTFDNAENIRPVLVPIPFEPQLPKGPITHLPQRMDALGLMHPMLTSFNQIQMRPPSRPQFMQVPRTEPQVSIHVQSNPMRDVPIPKAFEGDLGVTKLFSQQSGQMPQIQVERVPLDFALRRAGITPDDLRNIQLMAEERLTEGLRHLATQDIGSNSYDSESSGEDDAQSSDQTKLNQKIPEPELALRSPMQEQHIFQTGRDLYERSLPNPAAASAAMIQLQNMFQSSSDQGNSERPHYVQPRSVRSIPDASLHREKRVKRCVCDCGC